MLFQAKSKKEKEQQEGMGYVQPMMYRREDRHVDKSSVDLDPPNSGDLTEFPALPGGPGAMALLMEPALGPSAGGSESKKRLLR